MKRYVDVSAWQSGLDFTTIPNIDGIIIKLGENCRETETAREQWEQARNLGLPVGFYYFAHGLTVEDCEREGEWCVNKLKELGIVDYHIPLHFWLDYELEECRDLTMQRNTNNICAFLNKLDPWIKNYGVYSGYDILWNHTYLFTQVPWVKTWVAQYNSECDYPNATLWQYTDNYYGVDASYQVGKF